MVAGFQNGAVLLAEAREDTRDLVLRGLTGAPVTALAATPDFGHLLIGDAAGRVVWADLQKAAG